MIARHCSLTRVFKRESALCLCLGFQHRCQILPVDSPLQSLPLFTRVFTLSSLCVSLNASSPLLERTEPHWNKGRPSCSYVLVIIHIFITPAKTPFPSKFTLTGIWVRIWIYLFRGHNSIYDIHVIHVAPWSTVLGLRWHAEYIVCTCNVQTTW